MPVSIAENKDCMVAMAGFPDKFFDLAIVDPPYGIGEGNKKNKTRGKKVNKFTGIPNKRLAYARDYGGGEFDASVPTKEYFEELYRVSKNQIIWGGNYMVEYLPPSMGWIVWDKLNGNNDQSDCELAFTSFKRGLRKFTFRWAGMLQGDERFRQERIHPTEKPVRLYEWILKNYAHSGDKILDTHLGSGSSRIAAMNLEFDFWGYEIDQHYFNEQEKRFNKPFNNTLF